MDEEDCVTIMRSVILVGQYPNPMPVYLPLPIPSGGEIRPKFRTRSCYGGYFTAAQGILLVGMLGTLLPDPLQRLNALKNLLALAVNAVAAIAYTLVAYDRISWEAAGLIAAGSLVGGLIGASVGRRLPAGVLRGVIVVLGIVGIWRIVSG